MMSEPIWYSPATDDWNFDAALYADGVLGPNNPFDLGNDWLAYTQARSHDVLSVSSTVR